MSSTPYIVGISGGSASGKTSFLKKLRQQLPEDALSIVSQDNYYRPKEHQQKDENGQINFDLPTSIDRLAFYNDMQELRSGKSLQIKEYNFNNAAGKDSQVIINPAPLIVMEGLFIFHYEEIRKALDLRVYIDTRDEVKLERRLKRDKDERGYAEDTVLYQWHNHVMPSYHRYLRPYRDEADIIVTNNTSYDKGLFVLVNHLKSVLASGRNHI
jgi:uridine kinase